MKTSTNGIELIKKYEGCKLEAYKCPANVYTIGYGHTDKVTSGMKITEQQAEIFLKSDLIKFEKELNEMLTVEVTQNQFDALMSFIYNLGATQLKSSTLLRLLNEGKTFQAAQEFDKWSYGGGKRLEGLIKRRAEEKALFLKD